MHAGMADTGLQTPAWSSGRLHLAPSRMQPGIAQKPSRSMQMDRMIRQVECRFWLLPT